MALAQLLQQIEDSEWVDIPTGWLQGRTLYGGLAAGMLLHKAQHRVNDASKKLLSCSVTFVGPVQPAAVRLSAEILRQGKSVTTIEVRLWQDDAVQTILIASFGSARSSEIGVHQEPPAPDYPAVEQLQIMPNNPMTPECFHQFQLAWAEGAFPFSGSQTPDFGGWFRFNPALHSNHQMSLAELLILADIWPPAVLPMFKLPAPASSLTWQMTFVHPLQQQLHDWLKYKVITEYAANGYSTEAAYIWDANDQLIAISRQTVTIFA
ncbi:acyl-CoA thioesterase [Acinetobacter calcoaceticus]|uniref:Acyl-CoA thioesterase n=1 Tax=Acinetobacter calcoaceticus TaxID=471 RepID=A0A4R1Y708_ACICA|nr:acyl-CoA thioesterase [Acinetobacter calcoaceticus]